MPNSAKSDPDLLLEPPVRYSRPRRWMLKTVEEAIDYLNSSLTEEHQGHQLVKAARERLYYAAETGIRTDIAHAREALERALRELKIGGN